MYRLLVKLMAIAALTQLGVNVGDLFGKHPRERIAMLEKRSRDVLKIDWKPIMVIPEEATRFQ